MSTESPTLGRSPEFYAGYFNEERPALGWTPEQVQRYMASFDEGLGESMEDHLQCFADHDILASAS